MGLGKQFKELRVSENITQTKLSRLTGIGRSTIWRFEKGDYDIKLSTLETLIKAIDCVLKIHNKPADGYPTFRNFDENKTYTIREMIEKLDVCEHISQGVFKPVYCSNCGKEL